MSPLHAAADVLLGLAVGTLGTLIGAGGGFLLLPVLVLLRPHEPAAMLTAISLAIVCLNATSGTWAYSRMGRIDYRAAVAFSLAGLPGSVAGAWATQYLDRRLFDPLLGAILLVGALFIVLNPPRDRQAVAGGARRRLVERDGTVHSYSPKMGVGIAISVGVGFLSSLLGIGGGVIHVPAMVYVLGFPTHVATATSHAVLAVLSLAGVLVHAREGTLALVLGRVLPVGVGVLIGAQVGARLSSRVHGRWILRSLAAALATVGLRLLFWR